MKGTRLLLLISVVFLVVAGFAVSGWSQNENTETQPAETTEAAAPTEATAATEVAIQIQDAVVCQDVVDRAPVGSGDVFAKESPKVFCYCRVIGAQGETKITHNWYYKGNLKASVELNVRSDNWRTWSSKTMDPTWTGEWMVEILSAQGTPLESIIFFIQ